MDKLGWRKKNDDSERRDDNPRSTPSGANRGVPPRGYDRNDTFDRMSNPRGTDPNARNDPGGGRIRSPFGGDDKGGDKDRDKDKDKGGSRLGSLLGRGKDDSAADKPARPTGQFGSDANARRGSKGKGSDDQAKGGSRLGGFFGRGKEEDDKGKDKGKEQGRDRTTSPFVSPDRGAPGGGANRPDVSRQGFSRGGQTDASNTGERRFSSSGTPGSAPRTYGGGSPYGSSGSNRYGAPGAGDDEDEDQSGPRRYGTTSPGAPSGPQRTYGSTSSSYGTGASRYGASDDDDDDPASARRYGGGTDTYNRPASPTSSPFGSAARPGSKGAGVPNRPGVSPTGSPYGSRDPGARPATTEKDKDEKRKSGLGGFLRRSKGQDEDKDKGKDKGKDAARSLGSGAATGTRPPAGGFSGSQASTRQQSYARPADDRTAGRPDAKTSGKQPSRGAQRGDTGAGGKSKDVGASRAEARGSAAMSKSARPVAKPLDTGKTKRGALTTHQGLDFNRQIDLVGLGFVAFALIGFFAVAPSMSFGVLPTSQGGITGGLNDLLSQLFGWGKIVIPLAAGAVGIWLMAERFDEATGIELNYFRIAGMLLLFACALTWLQFGQLVDDVARSVDEFRPMSYQLAVETKEGGGWFGHQLYLFLLTQLGDYGTIAVLIPWMIVALMLTFDLSVVELVGIVTSAFSFLKFTSREERIARRRARLAMKSGEVAVSRPGEPALPGIALAATAGSAAATAPGLVPSRATSPAAAPPASGKASAEAGALAAAKTPDSTKPPVRPGIAGPFDTATTPTSAPAAVPAAAATGSTTSAVQTNAERTGGRLRMPHLRRGSSAEPENAPVAPTASTGAASRTADDSGSKGRLGLFGRKQTTDQPAESAAAMDSVTAQPAPVRPNQSSGGIALASAVTGALSEKASEADSTDPGKRGLGRFLRRGSGDKTEKGGTADSSTSTRADENKSGRPSKDAVKAGERTLASPFDAPARDDSEIDRPGTGRDRFAERPSDRAPERSFERPSERSFDRPSERLSTSEPADLRETDERTNPRRESRTGLGSAIAGAAAGAIAGAAMRALSDSDEDSALKDQNGAPTPQERPFIRRHTSSTPDAVNDRAAVSDRVSVSGDPAHSEDAAGWRAASVPDFAERARRRALRPDAALHDDDEALLDHDDEDSDMNSAGASPPVPTGERVMGQRGGPARPDTAHRDAARFQRPGTDTAHPLGSPFGAEPAASAVAAEEAPTAAAQTRPETTEPTPTAGMPPRSGNLRPHSPETRVPESRHLEERPPAGRPLETRALPGRSLPGAPAPDQPRPDQREPGKSAEPSAAAPAPVEHFARPARIAGARPAPGPRSAEGGNLEGPSQTGSPPTGRPPADRPPESRALPGRSLPGAPAPGTPASTRPAEEPTAVRPSDSDTVKAEAAQSEAVEASAGANAAKAEAPNLATAALTEPPARPAGIVPPRPSSPVPPPENRALPGRSLPGTHAPGGPGVTASPASSEVSTPALARTGAPAASAPKANAPTANASPAGGPPTGTPHTGSPIVRRHTISQDDEATQRAPANPSVIETNVPRRPPVPRVAEDDIDDEDARGLAAQAAAGQKARNGWELPDYRRLLRPGDEQRINDEVLLDKARVIEDTLMSFGAPGKVVEVNPGPVITQFGVEPDYMVQRSGKKTRVKVNQIARLDADLALSLAAKTIRIEAPVPGKGYVGIEVPNDEISTVGLRDVMDTPEFRRVDSRLRIALGLGVDGTPVTADLTAMPHLLIAGTTGSGKSVCVNSIISCLLLANKPDEVQFIMVDPKRVELTGYNGVPHLVAPVVVDLERIVGVLQWVQREMEERYRKFAASSSRNILDYNSKLPPDTPMMPYYVVVVDELADLMMLAPDETERLLARLAQMARATGIHLIISTQRPSVDVVTGLIKANFPARIAFAVASSVDSRVILDQPGAEKLLGRGDMLFQSPDAAAPLRMQGVFVSDEEINTITRYWKSQALSRGTESHSAELGAPRAPLATASPASRYDSAAMDASETARRKSKPNHNPQQGLWSDQDLEEAGNGPDDMYGEAVELVQRLNKASISLLQRRLRIGYTRAARLIDLMEQDGIIGPAQEGSKPREVISHAAVGGRSAASGDDSEDGDDDE